jgi:hypothetical protein
MITTLLSHSLTLHVHTPSSMPSSQIWYLVEGVAHVLHNSILCSPEPQLNFMFSSCTYRHWQSHIQIFQVHY